MPAGNLGSKPITLIIALLLKIVNGAFYRYGLCFIRGEKRAIMWGLEVLTARCLQSTPEEVPEMKLKIGNKVYLEKCILEFILNNHSKVPSSITQEACRESVFLVGDPANKRQFQAFEMLKNIRWLQEQEWIIDYDEYSKKPLPDLRKQLDELKEQERAFLNKLGTEGKKHLLNEYSPELDKYAEVVCRRNSILEIIRFREGEIKLLLPDGYGSRN